MDTFSPFPPHSWDNITVIVSPLFLRYHFFTFLPPPVSSPRTDATNTYCVLFPSLRHPLSLSTIEQPPHSFCVRFARGVPCAKRHNTDLLFPCGYKDPTHPRICAAHSPPSSPPLPSLVQLNIKRLSEVRKVHLCSFLSFLPPSLRSASLVLVLA